MLRKTLVYPLLLISTMAVCETHAQDGEEIRDSRMEGRYYNPGGYIPGGEYKSSHVPASLLTVNWLYGSCLDGEDEEKYWFKADYKAQGTSTSGTFTILCGEFDVNSNNIVEVHTQYGSTYDGFIHIDLVTKKPIFMFWDTPAGVSWNLLLP